MFMYVRIMKSVMFVTNKYLELLWFDFLTYGCVIMRGRREQDGKEVLQAELERLSEESAEDVGDRQGENFDDTKMAEHSEMYSDDTEKCSDETEKVHSEEFDQYFRNTRLDNAKFDQEELLDTIELIGSDDSDTNEKMFLDVVRKLDLMGEMEEESFRKIVGGS
ncbi:hypothetical protein L6452_42003 [Arctium lappa]|uniref:Uncharacterized protein n=1 Tax=Arctium lappa TaxID=4217 RepID=A0ACB8XI92_ARCLA|nr:hypothetical protein L6452_42003 [Arctium lappa]